ARLRSSASTALRHADTVHPQRAQPPPAGSPRLEPAARVRAEDPVEVALPAKRAVDELGRERDVARRELPGRERPLERDIGEIRACFDALQRVSRDGASGRRVGRGAPPFGTPLTRSPPPRPPPAR